ncbi:MAG: hypothetical protein ACLR0U_02370 [Enterocloster clostridioformis]
MEVINPYLREGMAHIKGRGSRIRWPLQTSREAFRTPSGKMMIDNENLEEAMPRYMKSHGEHTLCGWWQCPARIR